MTVGILGDRESPHEEPRLTYDRKLIVAGLGPVSTAYERLLFNLCKSGCTLPKIQVIQNVLTTVILYTVEGTKDQLAIFREAAEG